MALCLVEGVEETLYLTPSIQAYIHTNWVHRDTYPHNNVYKKFKFSGTGGRIRNILGFLDTQQALSIASHNFIWILQASYLRRVLTSQMEAKTFTGWLVYHATNRPMWEYKRGKYELRDVYFFRCIKNVTGTSKQGLELLVEILAELLAERRRLVETLSKLPAELPFKVLAASFQHSLARYVW